MKMWKTFVWLTALVLAAWLAPSAARAQSSSASLVGKVTDTSGAVCQV